MQKFLAAASFVSSNLNRGGDGHGQSVFWMALMIGTMFLGQKCFGSVNGVTWLVEGDPMIAFSSVSLARFARAVALSMIAGEVNVRFLRVDSPRMHSATPMLGVIGVVASDFDNGGVTVDVGFGELGGVE